MRTIACPIRSLLAALALAMLALPSVAQERVESGQASQPEATKPSGSALTPEMQRYANQIRAKVRGNIALPSGIQGNPTVIVRVTQLPTGVVLSTVIIRSSGNEALDTAVVRAVQKSSPLPLPEGRAPDRVINIQFRPSV